MERSWGNDPAPLNALNALNAAQRAQPNPTQVGSAGLGDAVQLVERFGDVEGRREEFRRGTSVLARGCGEERRRDVAFGLSRDTTQKSGEHGSS